MKFAVVAARKTSMRLANGAPIVGNVERIWRYPVKSMRGEQCESVDVNARGVEGDRLFALQDANGKFGSGKSTNRFRCIDGLLEFQAIYEDNVPVIHFPDGRKLRQNDPYIHTMLSKTLGQEVALIRERAIPHFDVGAVHILTSASLTWLQALLPEVSVDERRFRPNLVIDVPGSTQVEVTWIGKILAIGDTVRLRVKSKSERCGMVALAQEDLPSDIRVLEFLAQEADLNFGVYAEVLVPGRIRRGDYVKVMD